MKLKTYNNDLSLCNQKFILCDWDVLDKKSDIQERCAVDCVQKFICLAVCDLLSNGKPDRASEILTKYNNHENKTEESEINL